MQTNPFDTMIRSLEGKLTVARDSLKMYEDLFKKWRDDVNMLSRMVAEAKEAKTFYEAAQSVPAEEKDIPLPASVTEVKAHAPSPFPAAANGFDRNAVRRQLRNWNVGYPLAKSYEHSAQLARQACIAELTNHREYLDRWVDKGHVGLTSSMGGVTMDVIENCAKVLGVDLRSIRDHALRLQADVAVFGKKGEDFLW